MNENYYTFQEQSNWRINYYPEEREARLVQVVWGENPSVITLNLNQLPELARALRRLHREERCGQ